MHLLFIIYACIIYLLLLFIYLLLIFLCIFYFLCNKLGTFMFMLM